MAKIHIDGKEYDVDGSANLLEACLSLGLDVPYFCWHPSLGSVGACRQCAIKQFKNEDDTKGRIVMSCMTPASEGTYISIDDDEAAEFRKSVIEWLMTNHPHDCPVCEEGGNCHLQDMTVMTGHSFRKYRFNKRTHNNQDLGPFIAHEMNRCIACYRCVRYYNDYADGTDFGVYGAHDNLYFGRTSDGTLESEFAGNLVDICPTGVFTDKTHSGHYARKWDMQFAPSICQQCSVGCNIAPGERYGQIRRIENGYNHAVNGYFLCDRGRFGYGYVNNADRPRQPVLRVGSETSVMDREEAIIAAATAIGQAQRTIGIGSPRASLESNFALRELVGPTNFFTGLSIDELSIIKLIQKILRESGLPTPSLADVEQYDAILVLGEDVTQTGARIALSLRQAVKGKASAMAAASHIADWQIAAIQTIGQNAKYPLFVTNVDDTRLSDIAAWHYNAPISEQARLGFALAHAIDPDAPPVPDLDPNLVPYINMVADAFSSAQKPLIISGSGAGSRAIIHSATNVAMALKKAGKQDVAIAFIVPEVNSMGMALLSDNTLDAALQQLQQGQADTLVVLENDLYRHSSATMINDALCKVNNLIVLDHQRTALFDRASIGLSSASFAESDGSVVSQEGRVQRFYQVYDPAYYDRRHLDASGRSTSEDVTDLAGKSMMLESWRWLHALTSITQQKKIEWSSFDCVVKACASAYPELSEIASAGPKASWRIHGLKIAREPHRYSGRTAMLSNISVHEPRQPQDKDTSLTFSMEGYSGTDVPRKQIPFAWAPGWNSVQAWNKFQLEVGGPLKGGDAGVLLFHANAENTLGYFNTVPRAYTVSPHLTVVPYYHLFGSEELSQRSGAMLARMSAPYIMFSQADAAQRQIVAGSKVSFMCNDESFTLTVRISEQLATGLVGLPVGTPAISPVLSGKIIRNLTRVLS